MKRFLTFLKVEGKLSLRSPDGIIFGIGMPVGVLLLIAVVAGSQSAGVLIIPFYRVHLRRC